jgi:hypothetical protein
VTSSRRLRRVEAEDGWVDFHFAFLRLERVSHELDFHSNNQMKEMAVTFVIRVNLI